MFGVETRKRGIAGGRQIGAVCDIRNARQNATLACQYHAFAQFRRACQNLSQQGFGLAKSCATPIQPVNIGIVDQCQAKIESMGDAVGRGSDIRINKAPAPKPKRGRPQKARSCASPLPDFRSRLFACPFIAPLPALRRCGPQPPPFARPRPWQPRGARLRLLQ